MCELSRRNSINVVNVQSVKSRMCNTGAALALSLFMLGCSNPLSPNDTAGVYGWSGTTDIVLPSNETVRVVADTIVLDRDRSGVRRTYTLRWPDGALASLVEVSETLFDYRIEGRAIGFHWHADCTDIACTADLTRDWFDFRGAVLVSRADPQTLYIRGEDVALP